MQMNIVLYLYRAKILSDMIMIVISISENILYVFYLLVEDTPKAQTSNYSKPGTLCNIKKYKDIDVFYKHHLVQKCSEKFHKCLDFTSLGISLVIILLLLCVYQFLLFLLPLNFIVNDRNMSVIQ